MKEETEFVKTALFNKSIKENLLFALSAGCLYCHTFRSQFIISEFTLCDVNICLLWAFNSLGDRARCLASPYRNGCSVSFSNIVQQSRFAYLCREVSIQFHIFIAHANPISSPLPFLMRHFYDCSVCFHKVYTFLLRSLRLERHSYNFVQ